MSDDEEKQGAGQGLFARHDGGEVVRVLDAGGIVRRGGRSLPSGVLHRHSAPQRHGLQDIYALACIFGGLIFFASDWTGLPQLITQVLTISFVILVRILSVKYHISLPILKGSENEKQD